MEPLKIKNYDEYQDGDTIPQNLTDSNNLIERLEAVFSFLLRTKMKIDPCPDIESIFRNFIVNPSLLISFFVFKKQIDVPKNKNIKIPVTRLGDIVLGLRVNTNYINSCSLTIGEDIKIPYPDLKNSKTGSGFSFYVGDILFQANPPSIPILPVFALPYEEIYINISLEESCELKTLEYCLLYGFLRDKIRTGLQDKPLVINSSGERSFTCFNGSIVR